MATAAPNRRLGSRNATRHASHSVTPSTELTPIRLKVRDAARFIAVSERTIETLIAYGVFTLDRDDDKGHRYVLVDELREWVNQAGKPRQRKESALRVFRQQRGRA